MKNKAKHWYDDDFNEAVETANILKDIKKLQDIQDKNDRDIKKRQKQLIKIQRASQQPQIKKPRVYNNGIPPKYRSYINRANKKQIEFSLSMDEFNIITAANCTYCGSAGGGIDRINSKMGYTIENSTPCCKMCNLMKYTHSQEDFISQIKKIHRFLNL